MAEAPRAILFDLQGTCTDFFTPVLETVRITDRGRCPETDWEAFVAQWRQGYMRALGNDGSGSAAPAWRSVRGVYRQALGTLLEERGIDDYDETDCAALTLAWEAQSPWPDTIPGLRRLSQKHIVGTLTNGDVSATINVVKAGGLPFDVLLSAEMFQAFKPDPSVYLSAARWLSLEPAQIMLVACHQYDLKAAHRLGLQTAFVPRPLEFGPKGNPDLTADPQFTIVADDFLDLAAQLGC